MIDMDKKEQILHYHRVDGLSLREIARRTGLNRKTVTRYIREYEAMMQSDPEEGIDMCLASKPKYPERKTECTKLTEQVCTEIEYWLAENARRRQTGMRKQCLKRQDIHRALIEKGFNVSYSSVCKYIQGRKAEKSKKPKDVFVKQWYEPGQECEFDWGEVKLRIAGKPVTFTMAVFALCHSEGRWAYLFRHQDNLAFMESHRNFFHDMHGVPHTMVYDNMKVAVILKPDGKQPTETLMRMEAFYGFTHRFCNARAGWEKGHVERSVDYVRGRAFTTRVDFASVKDAQTWLSRICDNINGKTHIAIGLGVKACLEGYSVFFTSVPHLLTLIREAKTEKTLRNLELRFERFDLVICDELGYVGFDKEGAEMLFNHLSLRTGKKATIITTNLPFTRWEEVLKDKVLCSALVDRLCHKSYLVNMTGASYRVKETKKIINKANV